MEKQPLVSKRVDAGRRTYYLDIYKDGEGNSYLTIAEVNPHLATLEASPEDEVRGKNRHRILIHEEHIRAFAETFNAMVARMVDGGL